MELKSITVSNFRSIKHLTLDLSSRDAQDRTFGLIGPNEAGKTSLLKAIAVNDSSLTLSQKDFRDKKESVTVAFDYVVSSGELFGVLDQITATSTNSIESLESLPNNTLCLSYYFDIDSTEPMLFASFLGADGTTMQNIELSEELVDYAHQTIFWTAEDKYLISKAIPLSSFAADPDEVSIPLRNCFLLAGIDDIAERCEAIGNDSTEIEQLENELAESVTSHIQSVWPDHPIKVTFKISDGKINFHVKDLGASGKALTADQRSDGFKHFVSFLLTVSAQNKNNELTNTILLLDEPETHLHPLAQEYLLQELIKITANDRNNIVLFATHSNHMIDKGSLNRNFRVEKIKNETSLFAFDRRTATYASVAYEVFQIASTDYHNELYGELHARFQDEDAEDQTRYYITEFDSKVLHGKLGLAQDFPCKGKQKVVTLPTYIRNSIHHPDNGNTYSHEQLVDSIEKMKIGLTGVSA